MRSVIWISTMRLFEDTFSAAKPIYYLSIATATLCVIYNKDGGYSRTSIQILQTFMYAIIVLAMYVLSILENFNIFGTSLQTSAIINFIRNLYTHGTNITTACALLVCQVNAKKYISISSGIVEIDNRLKKLGLRNSLLNSNYMLWKYSTVLMLLISEMYLLVVITISIVFEKYAIYELIAFIISFQINTAIKLRYFTWTATIRERFKILNQLLKVKMNESMLIEKYPVDENLFADEIDIIKEEHKKLTKIARSINTYYSFLLLTYTGLNFVIFLTEAYSFIYVITFSKYIDEGSQFLLYNSLQLLTFATFQLFCIVRYTTLMCYEANYSKELLHGIRIHPEKVDSRNLVISTSLHLMHDKLEISACRLFNVDFSLLHSICAAITIYLVIMLQFDIDATKKQIQMDADKQANAL